MKTYLMLLSATGALTAGAIILTLTGVISPWYWLVALLGYFLYGCIGITVTHHRLLAHRSFKAPRWFEIIGSFLGAMAGTSTGIGWVAVHRTHHRHADGPGDPHDATRASLADIARIDKSFEFNHWIVKDLVSDSYHYWLSTHYYKLLAVWGVLIFILFGWKVWLFLQPVSIFMVLGASIASVFLGHGALSWTGSYRRHPTDDHSVNSWLNAFLVFGEGWHNSHHNDPSRYYFGERWWEIDIGGLVVAAIRRRQT